MQNKKSFAGRFAGSGYYIALILCAVVIGIAGYLYYHNANQASVDDPGASVDVMNPDGTAGSSQSTQNTQGSQPAQPSRPPRTGRPVSGEIIMDYAMDCLCYNPTTRDWRTHDGMDFAAQAGDPVAAAADGTVYTVYTDETMGTTVVIRHDGGYVTTYASLTSNVPVKAGDTVTLGQTIGYVGTSALMEIALGDHLHFAVSYNGQSMDPEAFFDLS